MLLGMFFGFIIARRRLRAPEFGGARPMRKCYFRTLGYSLIEC